MLVGLRGYPLGQRFEVFKERVQTNVIIYGMHTVLTFPFIFEFVGFVDSDRFNRNAISRNAISISFSSRAVDCHGINNFAH